MATNFTPKQALDYAKRMVGNLPIDDVDIKLRILNDAAYRLHMFAPWSWTVGYLDAITLVTDQDDYAVTDPGDVMHLLRGDLIDPDGSILDRHIWPAHNLPADDSAKGPVNFMELTSATNVRLYPTPSGQPANTKILPLYRKAMTQITEANDEVAATLDFPDEWHWVYDSLVLFEASRFDNGGVHQGTIQVGANGQTAYTGQYAEVMANLEFMRRVEKPLRLDTGEPQGA